jgi:hypothetical protein
MPRILAVAIAALVLMGAPVNAAATGSAKCFDPATCSAQCFATGLKRNCNKVCAHQEQQRPACKSQK